jgi:hypothetical protein
MTINSRYHGSSTAEIRSVQITLLIIFGLVVLASMTMSQARTDAFARMSNSGTASRSGKTAWWRLAGAGGAPLMMAFNEVLAQKRLVASFALTVLQTSATAPWLLEE